MMTRGGLLVLTVFEISSSAKALSFGQAQMRQQSRCLSLEAFMLHHASHNSDTVASSWREYLSISSSSRISVGLSTEPSRHRHVIAESLRAISKMSYSHEGSICQCYCPGMGVHRD
ncbi:hypothetical protein LZ30DRAFT_73477 [Colletotrichum cereale]|nr:hypothetical protein LZ30DRAFT_73477 [Colletotrichum cereale]